MGRDVLTKMDLRLTNEYSPQAGEIMSSMGYTPGKGLGKSLQGITRSGLQSSNKIKRNWVFPRGR